jgi:hypothetical protein
MLRIHIVGDLFEGRILLSTKHLGVVWHAGHLYIGVY